MGDRVGDRVSRQFLARARSIECGRPGCEGRLETSGREVRRSLGTGAGATVVLHCTEQADHVHAIQVSGFTPEEQKALRARIASGGRPGCLRCGTELEVHRVEAPGVAGTHLEGAALYICPWCGVRWVPPGDIRARMG